jgi:hypothetical protein
MPLPATNTAQLRCKEGVWNIAAADLVQRPMICDWCCLRETCRYRKAVDRMNDTGEVATMVRNCTIFVPPLTFSVLEGLNLPHWNTFRLGKAWGERLRPGQRVGIIDTRNQVVARHMIVDSTHVGRLEDLLPHHAHDNHAMRGRDRAEAPEALRKVLRNAYGSIVLDGNKLYSCVYLKAEADA